MKTLLIPVDFTATSENAVAFAVEWCKRYEYERIILLKTFYDSIFEGIIVSAGYSNVHQDSINYQREEMSEQLHELCKNVAAKVGTDVKVMTAVSEFPILRGIFEIIEKESPDLIIVGSDHHRYSSASIVAANVINIAKASPIRVLVVPSNYEYQLVKQALLPFNFNMLKDLGRLHSWHSTSQWRPKLLVLNIDTQQRSIKAPEKFNEAEEKFQNLLKDFEHEVHFATDKNLINSISNFAKEHSVQLIIALPGKHSFLYTLTHASISEAIYRNARHPVLILK